MSVLSIEAPTHGRVLLRDPTDRAAGTPRLVVGLHGYGQSADDMLGELERLPGAAAWTLVSIQALHRFYTRDNTRVIASWMTRQDRDDAIADNVEYVNRVIDRVTSRPDCATLPPVFVGFSQGASMAYRAALMGRHAAAAIVALGGDIPPEVKALADARWPPLLIGAGDRDHWFTATKLEDDLAFLRAREIAADVCRFDGGHEWTDAFRARAGEFLTRP